MKIAVLGYGPSSTRLHSILQSAGADVTSIQDLRTDLSGFERVVSFGYRHILPQKVLESARYPVANLHISLLPWNRGAHPNFWSWVEGTPNGVSIHHMDQGLDTGPILAQRAVKMSPHHLTMRASHERLVNEIENLFLEILPRWLDGTIGAKRQVGTGSYHSVRDLPDWMTDWDMPVTEAIGRYQNE